MTFSVEERRAAVDKVAYGGDEDGYFRPAIDLQCRTTVKGKSSGGKG
jgi:hypothetical protein